MLSWTVDLPSWGNDVHLGGGEQGFTFIIMHVETMFTSMEGNKDLPSWEGRCSPQWRGTLTYPHDRDDAHLSGGEHGLTLMGGTMLTSVEGNKDLPSWGERCSPQWRRTDFHRHGGVGSGGNSVLPFERGSSSHMRGEVVLSLERGSNSLIWEGSRSLTGEER